MDETPRRPARKTATPRTASKSSKRKASAPRRTARKASPSSKPPPVIPVDLTQGVEEALRRLRDEAKGWLDRGRYTKVRFRFRGKQVLPDMPLGAVIAAEAATFYWTGLLKALLVNVIGKSVLEVELINEADLEVARGKEHLLAGDLDEALSAFDRAISMDRDHAAGHLNRGIALKLRGTKGAAAASFREAVRLDPAGETGREAARHLESMT